LAASLRKAKRPSKPGLPPWLSIHEAGFNRAMGYTLPRHAQQVHCERKGTLNDSGRARESEQGGIGDSHDTSLGDAGHNNGAEGKNDRHLALRIGSTSLGAPGSVAPI